MTASKAELWDQLGKAVKTVDEFYKYCISNAGANFLTNLDTLQQAYEGDHIGDTEAQFKAMRSQLNSIAGTSSYLQYIITELARVGYDSTATNVSDALDDIAAGLDNDSETVVNRDWTYGSVSAGGSNAGSGTCYRLTTNKYGDEIEVGAYQGGDVKIEIISDKNAGRTPGTEQARIYGDGTIPTDNLQLGDAPGGSVTISAKRAADGMLQNPSFDDASGSGDSTFPGWTINSTSDFATEGTTLYRDDTGDDSGKALKFTGDNYVTQWQEDFSNTPDIAKPFFLIARYRRESSCDGTFEVRLGTKTETVNLTSKATGEWHDLYLGIGDSDGWYDNFKEDDSNAGFRCQLKLSSNTTGDLLIDEVILAHPTAFDGKYYLLTAGLAGSGTADFLTEDYFTFSDSVSNTGRIQTTVARLFGKDFPHATSGAETYSDA